MNDSGRSICAFQDQKYLFAQRCQGAVKVLELRRASAIVEHSSNLTIGSSVAKVGVSDGIDSGTVPVSVDFRAAVGLVGSNDGHESHEGEEDCMVMTGCLQEGQRGGSKSNLEGTDA
jgi:hypothetical protein